MRTTTKIAKAIHLGPADELTITVDQPMLVEVVNAATEEPVDVHMAKQWGTERELRQEVIRLRGLVKQLTWELENPDAWAPRRKSVADEMDDLVVAWRDLWRAIIEALPGRKGR